MRRVGGSLVGVLVLLVAVAVVARTVYDLLLPMLPALLVLLGLVLVLRVLFFGPSRRW